MLTDGRTTDAGVTGILIAHLGAFGSGELTSDRAVKSDDINTCIFTQCLPMSARKRMPVPSG